MYSVSVGLYDLYVKYGKDQYALYVKYGNFYIKSRDFWQLSSTAANGYM